MAQIGGINSRRDAGVLKFVSDLVDEIALFQNEFLHLLAYVFCPIKGEVAAAGVHDPYDPCAVPTQRRDEQIIAMENKVKKEKICVDNSPESVLVDRRTVAILLSDARGKLKGIYKLNRRLFLAGLHWPPKPLSRPFFDR
ncbi:hypothetical protein ACG10_22725 (plasmid) [Azotobacter chroococcum]|nr:hypothetical protein ACG10_22725 [Azotobacter chroococcum]